MERGWWKLEVSNIEKLDDSCREQIAKWILDGCTEGEVIKHNEDDEE